MYLFPQRGTILFQNLSNSKSGHFKGGSGRSAQQSGWAGSGKIWCKQNHSPRKQKVHCSSKASKKSRFNVSPGAKTSEILCKLTGEQNQWFTHSLSAFHHWDEKNALCVAAEQWDKPFVFVFIFDARYVREFFGLQNWTGNFFE